MLINLVIWIFLLGCSGVEGRGVPAVNAVDCHRGTDLNRTFSLISILIRNFAFPYQTRFPQKKLRIGTGSKSTTLLKGLIRAVINIMCQIQTYANSS